MGLPQGAVVDAPALRDLRASLLARRRLRGRRFCGQYAEAIDAWLPEVFGLAVRAAHLGDATGVALVAVGGYGRLELCPSSDLDLVLVHDNVKRIDAVADAIWYPIWDAGLQIDHSVRTPRETANIVDSDIKSALSLLSGRVVAGDAAFGARVVDEARERWKARPHDSLRRLRAACEERWEHHGELAFLLEPDVKLSRGGLRDAELLGAAALAAPLVEALLDDPRLERAADDLLDARVALHATTGRRGDRLLLEDQDAVARALGDADADELLPRVAAAARRISWATDQAWDRIDAWLAGPRAASVQPLGAGVTLRDAEIVLDDDVDLGAHPALALRVAAISARSGTRLGQSALVRLESETVAPEEPWNDETRDALLDLLGCGRAAVPVLEALDHIGVLGRFVREWGAVRSKPQRNAYHRFTVDRHLLETAAEAAELTRAVHRPDLLLVGAWLHDIGKGFPGDHTDAGVPLVRDLATRMGFDDADAESLACLVRDHLLLAETATRRDLSDPATIELVARRVGTIEQLDLLAALTHADSLATGHTSWNAWKAKLIDELVVRTRAYLASDRHADPPPAIGETERWLMAKKELEVVVDDHRVTVVAPDRSGLLAIVAGALAANGLPVRAATGVSEDGMAVETFDVDLTQRTRPDWKRLEADIKQAFADPGALNTRLKERARSGSLSLRRSAVKPAAPRVIFDNETTPRATILEVRAPDGVGVLSRIARALTDSGCDVSVVRALTLGAEVVDIFYITSGDAKVVDKDALAQIEAAILRELSAE